MTAQCFTACFSSELKCCQDCGGGRCAARKGCDGHSFAAGRGIIEQQTAHTGLSALGGRSVVVTDATAAVPR